MGKHKKKSSHKKKHKKDHKKKHKVKKSRKHYKKCSDSSDSSSHNSSSSSSSNVTTSSESSSSENEMSKHVKKDNFRNLHDEDAWDDLFSDRHMVSREKNIQKKERGILDKPGQSAKELNPYWKDGGTGLPPEREESKKHDVNSLKKVLEQAKDIVKTTGESLEKIVEEKWGPLANLKQLLKNAENECCKPESRESFMVPLSPSSQDDANVVRQRHMQFMKPGEFSLSDFKNSYSRNWKKKDISQPDISVFPTQSTNVKDDVDVVKEKQKILTPDEMNALAAKAMKAEIMGNKALALELRKQIEDAKNCKKEALSTSGRPSDRQREEVVLLTKTNAKGMTRPWDSSDVGTSDRSGRKRRGETHEGNERVRYFLDDDKHSLNSMFEREKYGTSDDSYSMFMKMAKKGKLQHDNDDLDDDFLDCVRGSNYERKAADKERQRALNESKAKHKSISGCRWCLDGTNVQKHLIISVGSKCYLCLPPDESLTEGHCLIVPIHHDTCGTMLDEDVWNEIQLYRKSLCKMFEASGQDVVFFENARSFHRFPHMVLNCVPMDREIGELAPIYFKKAIMESETEWSNNKKVVDLRKKDLRRSIPKGLTYFAVDFGRDGGFAHVIEDEKLFPPNFAEEVIGGMLDLDASKWRKRKRESFERQKEKVSAFTKMWKKYDLTKSGRYTQQKSPESSSSES